MFLLIEADGGDSQGEKPDKKDDSLSRVEEFTQVRLLACIY